MLLYSNSRGFSVRSLNRFTLIGNVASIRQFDKVVKITVATDRAGTDVTGKPVSSTDFNQVSLLNERQRIWAAANVGVGDEVFVEGRIQSTKFEKNGETHYGTDFVATLFNLLRSKDDSTE